jgi:predicted dinucleotide-binding enzyme
LARVQLAVLGSGEVGRTLAAGFAKAGHTVSLGTRDPEAAREWSRSSGVAVAVPTEAVRDVDVVINATPGTVAISAVRGAGIPDGVVLLDVSNPLDFPDGQAKLTTGLDDSVAEQLQRAFPGVRVVKSLCTVNNPIMVNPGLLPEPTTMFVAGDDLDAKATVAELLASVGWAADQVLDLGGIAAARRMEANILMWLAIVGAVGTPTFNIKVVRAG